MQVTVIARQSSDIFETQCISLQANGRKSLSVYNFIYSRIYRSGQREKSSGV